MSYRRGEHFIKKMNMRQFAMIISILFIAVLLSWWIIDQADKEMRDEFLQQAHLISHAVNIENIAALSGTEADMALPEYMKLKDQLISIGQTNPNCKWSYLMGRRADGTMFFFLDRAASDVMDAIPPGETYPDVPADYLIAFNSRIPVAVAHDTGKRGNLISVLVPINDSVTGDLLAVLGIDVEADKWRWNVLSKAALPLGLLLIMLIGLSSAFFAVQKADPSPKPVLKRLLIPVSILFLILITGAGILLWHAQQQLLTEEISHTNSEIINDLDNLINQQIFGLTMSLKPIAGDANVKSALRERNAGLLLDNWKSVFNKMNKEDKITHFYFMDANRVCLLRLHNPEKSGDIINRFTAIEAERTGNTSSGIELGPLGTFTLRVVQPVYDEGEIIGYVELGKEIEDVLSQLHARSDIEVALIIRKEFLTRQSWEEGMKLLGRKSEWDRFSESVISYSSQTRLPDDFMSIVDHSQTGENFYEATGILQITADMKDWHVTLSPLNDVSGKEVGDLLVMHDITIKKEDFARQLRLVGIAGGVKGFFVKIFNQAGSGF
ncbi:MAG: cache domain-containing protein [Clostridiales bacterium]|nr:cache domain-containing protein [Clostridiales bacterium]